MSEMLLKVSTVNDSWPEWLLLLPLPDEVAVAVLVVVVVVLLLLLLFENRVASDGTPALN